MHTFDEADQLTPGNSVPQDVEKREGKGEEVLTDFLVAVTSIL